MNPGGSNSSLISTRLCSGRGKRGHMHMGFRRQGRVIVDRLLKQGLPVRTVLDFLPLVDAEYGGEDVPFCKCLFASQPNS